MLTTIKKHISEKPAVKLLIAMLAIGLSSCLEKDFDYFSLKVQARGLSQDETISVSNGSTVNITGNESLSWTEPQRFQRSYREDDTDYKISVTRQPSSSNKVCRVLNPEGIVNSSNNMIRVECGFPIVVADTGMTMTTDNGLTISNGLETLALNASRLLTTSLDHEIVQDPDSANPEDQALRLRPFKQNGAITFEKLYMENDPVTLSFLSVNQGCEIASANNNSNLAYSFPEAETFMNTVQTIPLENDWILNESDFGNGRTCKDFNRTEYFLDLAVVEVPSEEVAYTTSCFPAPIIDISCGFALKAKARGLDENAGETVEVRATRTATGTTHTLEVSTNYTSNRTNRGTQTFNLAMQNSGLYDLAITNEPTGKNCEFDNASSAHSDTSPHSELIGGQIFNENKVDTITCVTAP
jgi:hypothetical protein